MADITMLILADHEWFREKFARFDYLQGPNDGERRRARKALATSATAFER